MKFLIVLFTCFVYGTVPARTVPLPELFTVPRQRSVREDSYILRRNEGDPCPVVVAPGGGGGGINFGQLSNFGAFFRGFSKQSGSYDTSFGGSGGPMNGGQLGIGGWNQIVPNSSKDCQQNQQQGQTNSLPG